MVLQLGDRHPPGRRHRQGIAGRLVHVEQPAGLLVEQLDVLVDREADLVHERPRLLEGERQGAEPLGEQGGLLAHPGAGPPADEGEALVAVEDVHVQGLEVVLPRRVAGGDEDMSRTARDELLDGLRLLGVVEDQQPSAIRLAALQFPAHGLGRVVHAGHGGGRQAEMGGHRGERRGDQPTLVGGDPPDQVIVRSVPPGVFDGQLRLADASPTLQRPRLRNHGRDGADALPEPLQKIFAAGEVLVPLRHLLPNLRLSFGYRVRRLGKLRHVPPPPRAEETSWPS